MDSQKFVELSKMLVADYFNVNAKKCLSPMLEQGQITLDDIYVVWLSKTLQNSKALLSTNVSDGIYYELTYNGDKNELYFDAYKKVENIKHDLN